MKIIGKTEAGFLISASEDDVLRLVGNLNLRYTNDKNLSEDQKRFAAEKQWIGLDIPLHPMYEAARETAHNWNQKREVSDTAKYLREMAGTLEGIATVYSLPKRRTP